MNDQAPAVSENRKTNRLRVIVLIIVVLLGVYAVYRLSLSHAVQSRIDSIHKAGFPATWAELDKWYRQPPPGENAADVYKDAFAHYNQWTNKEAQFSPPANANDKTRFSSPPSSKHDLVPVVGKVKLPPRTEPLPADTKQVLAEYLSDNAEALRLLHQAAAMKSCRYPIDLTKGMTTPLHHLNSVRQGARLLYLEAIQHTDKQESQEAVESVLASLALSRSLNQEPMIISYLVHVACQGIALDSLERILNGTSLTDDQLAKLAAGIEESENQQSLTRAFVGERCCGLGYFEGLRRGKMPLKDISSIWDEEPVWSFFLIPIYRATGLLELDERQYLDIMEQYVQDAQLPLPEGIEASHAAGEKANHLSRLRIVSRALLPAFDRVVIKEGRCDAKIRDAEAALAIERYRLVNGRLPTQLSDLVPTFLRSVPSDPFDGKPLRYKTLSNGYMVYSVGDDREDNGGVEKNSKGVSWVPGTDITFTVER
jgi:hypothetical protein